MGLGPIPRSKIESYVIGTMGLDGDDADVAIRVLRAVDTGYLGIVNAKDENGGKSVKADDASGMRGVFDRLKTRGNKEKPAVS